MCFVLSGVDLVAALDGAEPDGQRGARHDQRGRRGRLGRRGIRGVRAIHRQAHHEHRSRERSQRGLPKVIGCQTTNYVAAYVHLLTTDRL